MEEKIKKMNELRDRIRRQLLLQFYFTQDEETLFLLKKI
jgi:hypothetical protein